MAKQKKLISVMSKRQAEELDEIIGQVEHLKYMFEEIGDNEPNRASLMYTAGRAYSELVNIHNRLTELGRRLSGEEVIIW